MSKKEKAAFVLAEDFRSVLALVPKLESLIKMQKEIAAGYQKYRKNGGEAIPGVEKYLGVKEQVSEPSVKPKETKAITETKAPKEESTAKKNKKKA
ncbi:MAG: hypothetical protein WCI45_02455 [Desulfuromonadales bacterium]